MTQILPMTALLDTGSEIRIINKNKLPLVDTITARARAAEGSLMSKLKQLNKQITVKFNKKSHTDRFYISQDIK
jgi:Retroviral aspartyl protease